MYPPSTLKKYVLPHNLSTLATFLGIWRGALWRAMLFSRRHIIPDLLGGDSALLGIGLAACHCSVWVTPPQVGYVFFILFLFDHSNKDCHANRRTCVESLPSVEFVMGFRWTTVHLSYKPSWELLQMIPMFHIPRQRRVILILKVSGKLLGKRHLSSPGAPGS